MKKVDTSLAVILTLAIIFSIFLFYQLSETQDALNLSISVLETTKTQLDTTKKKLANMEKELVTAELQLVTTQTSLATKEIELQNTAVKLSTAEGKLEETESKLIFTEYELEAVEKEHEEMQNKYSNLRDQVNLRFGHREDSQKFITPDNNVVSARATEITGGYSEDTNEYWSDFNRLYRWVVNNIEYAPDSYLPFLPSTLNSEFIWTKECWRMPEETLEDGIGDCEDMATLLASLMLSYNNHTYAVWAIEITNEDGGHLAVAYPVIDNNLVIIDPAGNYYSGYPNGRFSSVDVSKAISDWLSHWKKEMPGAWVKYVFSDNFYNEFSSTEEFIDWVKER